MKKVTYKQLPRAIQLQEEFQGNNCYAIKTERDYKIVSYSTLILEVNFNSNKIRFDNDSYSMTTSKLQNIIQEVLGLPSGKRTKNIGIQEIEIVKSCG